MSSIITYFLIWTPLVLAVLSAISKAIKNKKKVEDDKKQYYLELTIIALTLIVFGFQQQNISIGTNIADIKQSLEESNGFKIHENISKNDINSIISSQLNRKVALDNSNKILSRVLFNMPESPNGKENDYWEELVTLKSFKSGSFRIKFFLGYEDVSKSSLSNTDNNNNTKRKKMQLISFKILTNPNLLKDDIKYIINKNAGFYYLPISKVYDSWSIHSSTDYYAGLVNNDQYWSGDRVYPTITNVIQIEDLQTAKSLNHDHLGFESWSKQKLTEEMTKEGYNREPIMVFISSDENTLVPKSLAEVEKIYNTWLKSYLGTLSDKNMEQTQQLVELQELIKYLKNEKYY